MECAKENSKKDLKRKINTSGEEKENKQPRREFKCSICLKVFAHKSTCIRHQISHDTFVACSFCGEKFRRKDYLKTHIKRKHQQQQRGEGSSHDEQLPISTVNQTENQRFLNDHDYIGSTHTAQHDQSSDHNYAISSKKMIMIMHYLQVHHLFNLQDSHLPKLWIHHHHLKLQEPHLFKPQVHHYLKLQDPHHQHISMSML